MERSVRAVAVEGCSMYVCAEVSSPKDSRTQSREESQPDLV